MGSSGVKKDALSSYGTNTNTAANAVGSVSPIYQRLASGTQGMTPQQMADARSGIMQAEGGSQSAATGAGNLMAARTGNVGGYGAAVDDAARQGDVQAQAGELQVQNQSDAIARANQGVGLGGLNSIYDTSTNAANGNLSAANNAAKPFWQQLLMQGVQGAGQVGAAFEGRTP